MKRRSCMPVLLLGPVLAILAENAVFAQDTERFERSFREYDRNNNGEIEPDEFLKIRESTRDRLLQMGIAGNRAVKKTEFMAGMAGAEEIRQKQQEAERNQSSSGSTSSSSSGSSGGYSRGSSDSRSRGRGKPRITFSLPSDYVVHDKNGDGQIALSEWDRAKLAEFRKLDRNGDGFLAPKELVHPSPTAVAVAPGTDPKTGAATATAAKPTSPTTNAKPSTPTTPATPAADPLVTEAKGYYRFVDTDKDGVISMDEWSRSRGARPMFEKAGVSPELPMSEATFIEHFQKVRQTPK